MAPATAPPPGGTGYAAPPAAAAAPPASAPVPAPVLPAPAAAPAAIPLGTSQAVYTVDSLVVSHPDDAPQAVIIKAMGSVRSGGWTEPMLEEIPDGSDPSVKSYRFVATSPTDTANAQALQIVEADLRVESLPAKVTTIRVVSETNEISASIE
jgi:hypothetical protein